MVLGQEQLTEGLTGNEVILEAGFLLGTWVYFCLKMPGRWVILCQPSSSSPWASNAELSFLLQTCCHLAVIPAQQKGGASSQPCWPPQGLEVTGKAHPGTHRTLRSLGGGQFRQPPLGDLRGPMTVRYTMAIVCPHLCCETGREGL